MPLGYVLRAEEFYMAGSYHGKLLTCKKTAVNP